MILPRRIHAELVGGLFGRAQASVASILPANRGIEASRSGLVTVRSILRWAVITAFEAGWAPLLVVGVHAVAIVGWNAYGRFPALDVPMHFAGGVAIAYFIHRAVRNAARFGLIGPSGMARHLLRVGAATLVAAVAWELAEFVLDRAFGTHTQPGPVDTLGDLLLGTLGGATCLAGVVVAERRRRGVGAVDASSFRD